jgi:myo-inositol-1(or 4)-monophosphatase
MSAVYLGSMESPPTGPQDLLHVALIAARKAAEVHRAYVGRVQPEDWTEKGFSDFVSHVDREAEVTILETVRSHYPSHAVLAEEASSADEGATVVDPYAPGYIWIVDPLDGTTNFLHGYPAYSVSVAVAYDGELQAGAVIAAATKEEWTATLGGGAHLNDKPIMVSGQTEMHRALIGTGFPFRYPELLSLYIQQFDGVLRAASDIRRAGSAALDLCHVASGYLDGFWELILAPWDVAAGTLIIREAGGLVSRLDGDVRVLGHGSILAGNASMHAQLGALVNAVRRG